MNDNSRRTFLKKSIAGTFIVANSGFFSGLVWADGGSSSFGNDDYTWVSPDDETGGTDVTSIVSTTTPTTGATTPCIVQGTRRRKVKLKQINKKTGATYEGYFCVQIMLCGPLGQAPTEHKAPSTGPGASFPEDCRNSSDCDYPVITSKAWLAMPPCEP